MWRILQHDEGDDFVLATNETHTIRELSSIAFGRVDLDWKKYVKHDERYERPAEVDLLIGDPTKAKKILDWEPKVRFRELVEIMVACRYETASKPTVQSISGRCRDDSLGAEIAPRRDLRLFRLVSYFAGSSAGNADGRERIQYSARGGGSLRRGKISAEDQISQSHSWRNALTNLGGSEIVR